MLCLPSMPPFPLLHFRVFFFLVVDIGTYRIVSFKVVPFVSISLLSVWSIILLAVVVVAGAAAE